MIRKPVPSLLWNRRICSTGCPPGHARAPEPIRRRTERIFPWISWTLALLTSTGCLHLARQPAISCPATEEAVRSVAHGLVAADNRGDLRSVLDHYTEHITFITPEGEVVQGVSTIRQRYEGLFAKFAVDIALVPEETIVDNELAFIRGRTIGTLRPKSAPESRQELDDRFLMVLRCDPELGWRVSHLMWSHRR